MLVRSRQGAAIVATLASLGPDLHVMPMPEITSWLSTALADRYRSEQTQGSQLRLRPRDQLDAAPLPGTLSATHPFFSPDGGRVAFLTVSPVGLHVAPLGGGPPITVADAGVSGQRGGAWGRDGHLYVQGLAPTHPRNVTSSPATRPAGPAASELSQSWRFRTHR